MCFNLPSSGFSMKNIGFVTDKMLQAKAGTHADRFYRTTAISSLKRNNNEKSRLLVQSFFQSNITTTNTRSDSE